jgi:hypothetical protein
LPSTVGRVAVGGGGRFLVLHLPQERKLAVFDTATAKVAGYIPAAEDEVRFAAGAEHLVVFLPAARAVQRWNLATREKERTVPSPFPGTVYALAMGSASAGPLVVVGQNEVGFGSPALELYDPKKFKKSDLTFDQGGRGPAGFHPQYPPDVRVSANGELITAWVPGLSPSGIHLWERRGTEYRGRSEHDSAGALLPSPDGRTVYGMAYGGWARTFAADGKPVGKPTGGHGQAVWNVPAVQGPVYVSLSQGTEGAKSVLRAAVHLDRDARPLVALPTLEPVQGLIDWRSGHNQPFDRHVYLIPDAKLLILIPPANDRLILRRFDLDALLDRSGVDYLFVTGPVPRAATAGQTFTYAPAVRSRKGGVKLKLESGPDGMKLAAGKLTWDVPGDLTGKSVDVILSIADASGQEVFHTLALDVGAGQ